MAFREFFISFPSTTFSLIFFFFPFFHLLIMTFRFLLTSNRLLLELEPFLL